jgi:hypothetical protein
MSKTGKGGGLPKGRPGKAPKGGAGRVPGGGGQIGRWLEEERQQQEMASQIAFAMLLTDILTPRPAPKREHWWQFWRSR